MAIHEWAEEHRPREKLLKLGPQALSDTELLAIVLRTGHQGCSALELARKLLTGHGGLAGLAASNTAELLKRPGLGPGKTAQWQACLEIGRRVLKAGLRERDLLTDVASAQSYVISLLRNHNKELFLVLYLDQSNRLISDTIAATGTVNQAAIYPREVVRGALEAHATGVIVAHNHPGGTLKASEDDLLITRKLRQALHTVDIRLLDHFIVAGPQALSLRTTTDLFNEPV